MMPALFLAFALSAAGAEEPVQNVAVQTECTILERKKPDEVRVELLVAAKRGAVNQLFGSLVTSLTKVKNFVLQEDEIRSTAMGFIRLKRAPEYYNGEAFGQVCVKIEAFASEEDRAKFAPREISKKTCVAEGDVNTIIRRAEEKAKLEALIDYDGSIKRLPPNEAMSLMHEVRYSDEGMVSGTTTYCVKASGLVYPIEVLSILTEEKAEKEEARFSAGLRGEYFNSPPFGEGEIPVFPVRPEYVRVDRAIDFDWGAQSPAPRISADFFLVRWIGEIYAPITGTYNFEFRIDYNNGGRLFVDDELVLGGWKFRGMGKLSTPLVYALAENTIRTWTDSWPVGDIYLEGGRWHRIDVEFYEAKDAAAVGLAWRPPGERNPQIIPTESLRTRLPITVQHFGTPARAK